MKKAIYLDYAAATPLDPKVLRAMEPYLTSEFYNPSSTYLVGRRARRTLEAARAQVTASLGAKPAEVTFTAGATEANNLAIQGLMKQYPDGEVVVSAIEHESVLAPAKLFNCKLAPVDTKGIVDMTALAKLINDKTVLVSVMMASNEIGSLQPIREITKLLRQIRSRRCEKSVKRPIFFHTDAAQAPCYLDIHVARLGVDMMSLNAGKIYGPKQSGVLYIKAGIHLQPLILGGGQENNLRSGTENLANFVGLAAALEIAGSLRNQEADRVAALRQQFIEGLKNLPKASINGSPNHSVPHIVSVKFDGLDNERLMFELDEAGIQAATGSACSASSQEPSYVLSAIGLSPQEARSSLRFSFGRSTTQKDINKTVSRLKELV